MDTAVDTAIADLYAAFADAPRPRKIEGCTHCSIDSELRLLLAAPLEKVDIDVIARYAFKAMSTMGTAQDFLYFLPRVIEVEYANFVTRSFATTEIDIIGKKIAMTNHADWPSERKRALEAVFMAMLAETVKGYRINDLLYAIGQTAPVMAPYLAVVAADDERLANVYAENIFSILKEKRLWIGFRDLPNSFHDEVLAWLTSPGVRTVVDGFTLRKYGQAPT